MLEKTALTFRRSPRGTPSPQRNPDPDGLGTYL